MPTATFSRRAYLKLVLHSDKYEPHGVAGFLLGSQKQNGDVAIIDTFPLVHGHVIGPILDISLSLISQYPKELQIIGFYYGADEGGERSPYINKVLASINSDFVVEIKPTLTNESGHIGVQSKRNDIGVETVVTGGRDLKNIESYHLQAFSDFEDHMNSPLGALSFKNEFVDSIV